MDKPSDKADYMVMTDTSLEERLQSFIESEGKSCSFDPELITPGYMYRMWGGKFSIEEIENGLTELRNIDMMYDHQHIREFIKGLVGEE